MTIKGTKCEEIAEFETDTEKGSEGTIVVHRPGADPVSVNQTVDPCEAFDVTTIGARLEAEARNKSVSSP